MFKKKRKRGGAKKERPQKPQTPFRPGTKYMTYSSMDALTPAFARTSISRGPVEPGTNSHTTQQDPKPRVPPMYTTEPLAGPNEEMPSSGTHSANGNGEENTPNQVMTEESSADSGSEGFSATSSDSDFSDSEAGQAARMW